jgi:AcrR family transcriptional regulator
MEHGYDGMSLSDLTKTTGLSKGAVYHHFRDKDDLFAAAIDQFFLQFLPEQAAELPAGVEATVVELVEGYASMLNAVDQVTADRLAYFRFILAVAPKIRPQLVARMTLVREQLIAVLAAEAASGRLRSAQPSAMLADQILGLMEGATLLAAIADRPDPADTMRRTVMAFLADIVR